ncbi:MAG: Crp/Fnr family transcriptional regulator [Alphaproteobacteria bacterium]|nr:Crp/Fnr family transcriptional regulator [Alphaproteobacteria bacterium]
MDSEALRNLEMRCRRHKLAPRKIILDQGDQAEHDVYFVLQGTVRIVNYSATGREIAFANVREGDYFGELGALTDKPRTASVITVTDCSMASMAPETFRNLLLDHPEIGVHVIERLAEIVQRCDQRIMDLSMLSAVQRVHVEILRLARPADAEAETWVIRSMPTHAEIASRASTVRETVARAMKVLTVAGIAQRKGKTLLIEDYERLAEMVESGSGQMIAAR